VGNKRLNRGSPVIWLVALAIASAGGCDLTGQYEANFQKALEKSAKQAVYETNLHAAFTEIVDANRQPVGVKLRLPKIFDGESKSVAAGAGMPIPLPGAYSIQRQLDDENGKTAPVLVMFAVMPMGNQKVEAIQAAMGQGLSAVAPGAKWEDVTVPTPTGESVTLKRLRMERNSPPDAKAKFEMRIDFYMVGAGTNAVMIAWSLPKGQAEKHQLEAAVNASMGTLEVTAPPAGNADAKAAAPAKAPSGCF
jgi:hypothetical protein